MLANRELHVEPDHTATSPINRCRRRHYELIKDVDRRLREPRLAEGIPERRSKLLREGYSFAQASKRFHIEMENLQGRDGYICKRSCTILLEIVNGTKDRGCTQHLSRDRHNTGRKVVMTVDDFDWIHVTDSLICYEEESPRGEVRCLGGPFRRRRPQRSVRILLL